MQAHEGLRHRGQDFLRRVPSEEPARAASRAAAPPAGPPSPPSALEWLPSTLEWLPSTIERLKSAFTQLGPLLGGPAREAPRAAAGAAAARASADAPRPPPADRAEVRRRTWAGVARSLGVAVRDPADYMERGSYGSASVLLQAKDGTLLPAHFAMVRYQPRFERSAECAWAVERFDPEQPLLLQLPFARFATANVVLLLRWIYKLPADPPFGRDGATEKEFKALAALFVEEHVAAAWWDQAGEAQVLGGAGEA
jgi:hypothetical protein